VWRQEEEDKWPEHSDPQQGYFVQRGDAVPYSALYVYLILEIIGGWVHVKGMLPSGRDLSKGPASAKEHCELLLRTTYKGAYNREQKMSVMLSFDDALWDDEDYHAEKRTLNPYWQRKKEVCTSCQHGHGMLASTVRDVRLELKNMMCTLMADFRAVPGVISLRRLVPSPGWYIWFRRRKRQR
jgi:hypothetical protein